MAGAHIFVMYADGSNNVTISARDGGEGHVEPIFDSSLFAGVELLEGTGINDGVMTANVRCMSPQARLQCCKRILIRCGQVHRVCYSQAQRPTPHLGSAPGI